MPQDEKRRVGRFGKSAWALLVALVALAGTVSTLVFTFLPELKPDPRDSVLAQLTVFAVDPTVTLGAYLQEAYGSDAAAPKVLRESGQLSFPGDVVFVRALVDGFKHRHVRLVAKIYSARTQRVVPQLLPQNTADYAERTVSLDTPSTSTIQLLFIPSLQDEPPTFVRVEMYDGTRMLAVTDSRVIRNNMTPLPPSS